MTVVQGVCDAVVQGRMGEGRGEIVEMLGQCEELEECGTVVGDVGEYVEVIGGGRVVHLGELHFGRDALARLASDAQGDGAWRSVTSGRMGAADERRAVRKIGARCEGG